MSFPPSYIIFAASLVMGLAFSSMRDSDSPTIDEITIPLGFAHDTPPYCGATHLAEHLIAHALAKRMILKGEQKFDVNAGTMPFSMFVKIVTRNPIGEGVKAKRAIAIAKSLSPSEILFEQQMLEFENAYLLQMGLRRAIVQISIDTMGSVNGCVAQNKSRNNWLRGIKALDYIEHYEGKYENFKSNAFALQFVSLTLEEGGGIENTVHAAGIFAFRFSRMIPPSLRVDKIDRFKSKIMQKSGGQLEIRNFGDDGFIVILLKEIERKEQVLEALGGFETAILTASAEVGISIDHTVNKGSESNNRFAAPITDKVRNIKYYNEPLIDRERQCRAFKVLRSPSDSERQDILRRLRIAFRFSLKISFDVNVLVKPGMIDVCGIGLLPEAPFPAGITHRIIKEEMSE